MKAKNGPGTWLICYCAIPFVLSAPLVAQTLNESVRGAQASGASGAYQSLAGHITCDQRPARRARITLTSRDDGRDDTRITDGGGNFRFERLAPGRYQVAVAKVGCVAASPSESATATASITLAKGESRPIAVAMDRAGALSGRLSDGTGRAPMGTAIAALRFTRINGRLITKSVQQTKTDDAGSYRLHTLPAGDYYVAVMGSAPQARPSPDSTDANGAMYYPGVATLSEAQPISLRAGEDLTGIDIGLPVQGVTQVTGRAQRPASEAAKERTTTITGRVIAADTQRPLALARVDLIPSPDGRAAKAMTDQQGRFQFSGLALGSYRVMASADGYVRLEYGQRGAMERGKTIDLNQSAREFDARDIVLPPTVGLDGTLVDEMNEPASGVRVQLLRRLYVAGHWRLLPEATSVNSTDDLGHFRVSGVREGDYYVLADAGFLGDDSGVWTDTAPTYYPGARSAVEAQPIHITGRATQAITFGLVPTHSVTVTGMVTDGAGQPISASLSLLQTARGEVSGDIVVRTTAQSNGTFVFRHVPDGTYVLQSGITQGAFGALPVTVGQSDVSDLRLVVRSGNVVQGRISFDGDAPMPSPERVKVIAAMTDFVMGPIAGPQRASSSVRDDWTFEIAGLFGSGVLRLGQPLSPWAIKSVTLDGRDVTDTPIEFRQVEGKQLEVTLTNRWAAMTGRVEQDGRSITDYAVVLFAVDRSKWAFPSRLTRLARPQPDSTFAIHDLPAGAYYLVALPRIEALEWQDVEFLEGLATFAQVVTLGDGENGIVVLGLHQMDQPVNDQ